MKNNKSILVIGIVVFIGVITLCFAGTLFGREERYEVRHEIRTPAYRTGIDRMIDAYQQLMDDYIRLTEKNLTGLDADVKNVQGKLDAMDAKMNALSAQLARIEKHLGIEPPEKTMSPPEQPGNKDL